MLTRSQVKRDALFLRHLLEKECGIHDITIKFRSSEPMSPREFDLAKKFGVVCSTSPSRFSCKQSRFLLSRQLSNEEDGRLFKAWDKGNVCKARKGTLKSGPSPSGRLWLATRTIGPRFNRRKSSQTDLVYPIGF